MGIAANLIPVLGLLLWTSVSSQEDEEEEEKKQDVHNNALKG